MLHRLDLIGSGLTAQVPINTPIYENIIGLKKPFIIA